MKLKSERKLDEIRGKLMAGVANQQETWEFLSYVVALESLVEEASSEDFYGTEGWRKAIGLE